MAAKQLLFDAAARAEIARGLSQLAHAVRRRSGRPAATSSSRSRSAARPSPRTASPSPRRSSCPSRSRTWAPSSSTPSPRKTGDVAGDGTTTATVLARAIYREGLQVHHRRRATRVPSTAASTRPSRSPPTRSPRISQAGHEARRTTRRSRTISRQQRPAHRQAAGRRRREGRQGRRHHRRGRQDHRDDARVRRGHAVRQGLPLARTSSPTRRRWKRSSRTPSSCSTRRRSATSASCCRC